MDFGRIADTKVTVTSRNIAMLQEIQRKHGGRIWFPDEDDQAQWFGWKWLPTEILLRVKGSGVLRYQ